MVFNKSNQKNKRSRTDIASEMSHSLSDFKHQLVPSDQSAQFGDKLFTATKVKTSEDKTDPDIECFLPGDREGTICQRLKALEIAMNEQLAINAANKAANQILTSKVNKLQHEIDKMRAVNLRNQVVQLFYGIMDTKIREIVPNASSIFGAQPSLKFEQIINSPHVAEDVKIRLRNDETYIGIKKAIKAGKFWNIV